jgi:SAM-dependent methyltransferase
MANEAESRRWNDPKWAGSWCGRERVLEAVSPFLLRAVDARPGQRVCDVGCGGGGLTLALASMVGPDGEAVGIDISAPFIELAQRRAADTSVGNARFVQLDMQAGTFEAGTFDLAVSQFGVMFFDEPLVAFRAIRRQLKAAGRLAFACWQEVGRNPWHVGTALAGFTLPPPPPPPGKSAIGPFTLGDDEHTRHLLRQAGFEDVRATPHELTVRAPESGLVDRSLLHFMGVPPDRKDEALAAVDRHLEQFAVGPDLYEYPLVFRVYEAVNPPGVGGGSGRPI